jgi:heme exporter protein A
LTEPLLELRELTCERDDMPLFAPLSLTLRGGDIALLEGANGVGKTSLLRCLCGLSSRYRGAMLWRGEALQRCRPAFAAASIFLGHATGLKAALSGRENLHWWAGLRGLDARRQVDAALERVGLAGYEDSPCYQLSAGQQRRVALARLFLADAQLWILDEPFTAIDRQGVAELEGWLTDFAAAGGAVLLTTHQTLTLSRPLQKVPLRGAVADV